MPMPLEGVRVLDWTIWQQGPVCGAILGDLGADVIKIEERVGGDPGRGMLRLAGLEVSDRPNFYFAANNRNKRGITLDLKKPQAREIVYGLAKNADVFVQNFRKGVADRLGIGYADLKQHNPQIIYANANGYGRRGPEAESPSYDYLGQARSGIMMAAGEPDMPPCAVAGGIADQMGAIMLAFGVVTALHARERFGVGQEVNASLLSSMMFLQGLNLSARLILGNDMPRASRSWTFNPLWNHYRCGDDRWIALGMLQADRYWKDFCRAIGANDLAEDPRFQETRTRMANAGEAIAGIAAAIEKKPLAEWMTILRDAGDFIFSAVQGVKDLPDDAQVKANDYVVDVEDPTFGTIQMIGMPFELTATPGSVRATAPEFGQHTEEVLSTELGYSWEDIARLKEQAVI
ncbi:MAG TPA: CoA transferase [Candidatus Binatia bacterium]|nr:CoA transferase [Candidatus Binatia bacterium]